MPVGGDVDRHHLIPGLRFDVIERRGHISHRRIADQNIEPPVTFVERGGEFIEPAIVPDVERSQRCRAAGGLYRIVKLFKPANSACHRNDVRASATEREGRRITDAPRGASNERDPIGEG